MARPSFASTSNPRTKAVSRSRPLLPVASPRGRPAGGRGGGAGGGGGAPPPRARGRGPPALVAQPVHDRAGALLARAGEGDAEGIEHGPLGLQEGGLRGTLGLRGG